MISFQRVPESADHNRVRDVRKISRKPFSETLPFGRRQIPRRAGPMRDVSVFCSIFSRIFFLCKPVYAHERIRSRGMAKRHTDRMGKNCRLVAVLPYPKFAGHSSSWPATKLSYMRQESRRQASKLS